MTTIQSISKGLGKRPPPPFEQRYAKRLGRNKCDDEELVVADSSGNEAKRTQQSITQRVRQLCLKMLKGINSGSG